MLTVLNITIFSYENTITDYLEDTIGMSADYVSYVSCIQAFSEGMMGLVTPMLDEHIRRRTTIGIAIIFIALANAFMGGCQFLVIP